MPSAPPGLTALRRFAVSITAFTVLGHLFLGFEQAYLTPVVALLTGYTVALLLETADARAHARPVRYRGSLRRLIDFLLPTHIAALACAMLLYGNARLWPTVFAVTVAVCGKYLIRIRIGGALRHVFNPSNLGISTTLICFSWVAIAPPYQFTEYGGHIVDVAVPALILVAGTMINAKLTGRMPLIAGWIGGFVLQASLRAAFLPDRFVPILLAMTGVAFVLFTNYMITDPGTTPSRPRAQVMFGLATALVYGALVTAHITFGLFYALTLVCAGRGLLELYRGRCTAALEPRPSMSPVSPAPAPAPVAR
jgi:enediyne biosynthesis protein E5